MGTSATIPYLGFETVNVVTGIVDTVGAIYATDIVLLFKATPAAGVIDSIGVNAVTIFSVPFSSGAGCGPDGTPDTSFVDIASFSCNPIARIFNFADGHDASAQGDLGPGEASDRFFVSYTAGDITFNGETTLNFRISPETGNDFNTSVTLAPEPSTLLLLGAGLGGTAIAGRRGR